jgi:hypothetical protein
MYWSRINEWCNEVDEPVSSPESDYCKEWKWVVPKYLYPRMEGYEEAKKEAERET